MMENTRTITYDDKTSGRKILTFPPELPFLSHIDELYQNKPEGPERECLIEISNKGSVYRRADALADHLKTSREPHREIMRIASMATANELAGIRLMYSCLLAIPALETLVEGLAEFRNVRRLMERIYKKGMSGKELRESEEWFKKKVLMLTMSHPLPNISTTPEHAPWLGWSEGVKRALDDPDKKWVKAVVERAKVELEALDLRIKLLVARLDLDMKGNEIVYLYALSEENRWRIQAIEEAQKEFGGATLIIKRRLVDRWDGIMDSLRESPVGGSIADLLDGQIRKSHPHPHLVSGTAILRALIMHPLMRRTKLVPDSLSCLSLFLQYAGKGIFELLVPAGKKPGKMLRLPGFELKERILRVDLKHSPSAPFVEQDEGFREIDWTDIPEFGGESYRSLVMTYIDNDNFLTELLDNPKAIGKPGVISVIAQRSRSTRILSIIANRRDLYTGFVNKDVPLFLLMNPSKLALMSLRKFIHVRYVDRPTLQRLAGRGVSIREEVRREVQRYLRSMG